MRLLACCMVLLFTSTAHATTLKELIDLADVRSVDRQMAQENHRQAVAELAQAWSGLLPSLTARGAWVYSQYPVQFRLNPAAPLTVITPKNGFDGTVRVELPLIDTTRWYKAAALGSAAEASELREEAKRDDIRRDVALTYYSYAAALGMGGAARRTQQVAEAQQWDQ